MKLERATVLEKPKSAQAADAKPVYPYYNPDVAHFEEPSTLRLQKREREKNYLREKNP
jgi:hypothetical protein